jgi:hypothetical protein
MKNRKIRTMTMTGSRVESRRAIHVVSAGFLIS